MTANQIKVKTKKKIRTKQEIYTPINVALNFIDEVFAKVFVGSSKKNIKLSRNGNESGYFNFSGFFLFGYY